MVQAVVIVNFFPVILVSKFIVSFKQYNVLNNLNCIFLTVIDCSLFFKMLPPYAIFGIKTCQKLTIFAS